MHEADDDEDTRGYQQAGGGRPRRRADHRRDAHDQAPRRDQEHGGGSRGQRRSREGLLPGRGDGGERWGDFQVDGFGFDLESRIHHAKVHWPSFPPVSPAPIPATATLIWPKAPKLSRSRQKVI